MDNKLSQTLELVENMLINKKTENVESSSPAISVRNLSRKFGAQEVLSNINFDIAEGELLVLLGQSGSGKTTILRCIAGLDQANGGEVYLKGKSATYLSPQKRNIGVVFQERDLFQRMTVEENIGFGLKLRKASKKEITNIVDEMLELINMTEHRHKYPKQLSGGQCQRVALARALAYKPKALLFDEPFSALDPMIRVGLRREVRLLLRKMNVAALFITHDQEEALELGDQIAILNKGHIEQIGTPFELYNNPKNEFVASFLGTANILLGNWYQNTIIIEALHLKPPRSTSTFANNQPVKIIFRPEDVVLDFQPQLLDSPYYLGQGIVKDVSYIGPSERLTIQLMSCVTQIANNVVNPKPRIKLIENNYEKSFPLTVMRSKWKANQMRLSIGDQIVIGLKDYQVFPHYPSEINLS